MALGLLNDKSWLSLTTDEKVLKEVNPSLWASLPAYVFGSALMTVGLFALLYTGQFSEIITPIGGFAILTGLFIAVAEEIRRRFTWYVLTTEQVYVKTGIIAQYPRKTRYDNIEDVDIDKTIVERIFGFADIRLATAGTNTQELNLINIPNAQHVKNEITNQIDIAYERTYVKSREEAEQTGGEY